MKLNDLIEAASPLLLDGGIGTQLIKVGLNTGGHNCLTHPDIVRAIDQAYVDTGSDAVTTNTIGLNAASAHGFDDECDIAEANLAGVELARAAAGPVTRPH